MGVADRAYMRGRAPPPIALATSWTLRLIVLLVAVFVFVRGGEGWFGWRTADWLVLSRDATLRGRVWTILTAALVHLDVWHLAFNGLALWFFGKLVEETLGSARYVTFVLLAAVLSHVPFLVVQFATRGDTGTIGASGVVMAALVFAAFRYPGLPVVLLFLPMKLWQLAALYVVIDLFGVLQGGRSPVDHLTHLGGAAFGFLVHRFGLPALRLPRTSRRGAPPREHGPYRAGSARAEIDRILDKINAEGIGSLSESEREFMRANSGRYDT